MLTIVYCRFNMDIKCLLVLSLIAIVQCYRECPSQCVCNLDDHGRIQTICNQGGMINIPILEMDPTVEVLIIRGPRNDLTIGPIFLSLTKLEILRITDSNLPSVGTYSFWGVEHLRILGMWNYRNWFSLTKSYMLTVDAFQCSFQFSLHSPLCFLHSNFPHHFSCFVFFFNHFPSFLSSAFLLTLAVSLTVWKGIGRFANVFLITLSTCVVCVTNKFRRMCFGRIYFHRFISKQHNGHRTRQF